MASQVVAVDRGERFSVNAPLLPEEVALANEGARLLEIADGLTREELLNFLSEMQDEPEWRREADICCDYYDSNQLDSKVLKDLEAMGIPPIIVNLIFPTVNAVLGMEAQTRTDAAVSFEDDPGAEQVATALNKRLKEAERESYADRAISDAYAGQIKAGLGCTEVGIESNPFRYRYRVRSVHRRHLWWDWRDREPDLPKARYFVRREWFDEDVLLTAFPKWKDVIPHALGGWNFIDPMLTHLTEATGLTHMASEIERAWTVEESEWRDTTRNRGLVAEVWYRKWQRGWVTRLPNGTVLELDPKNPRHAALIVAGKVQPTLAAYPKMRQSLWLGPYRLVDRPTPRPHQDFPYTLFFGYREDLTSIPYGMIRSMISPQDEVNARRSKMVTMLSARRTIIDDDAPSKSYNSHQDIAEEVGRHDAYIVLNPERRNLQGGMKVESNSDLSVQQFSVLQEAKAELQSTGGVFNAMMGQNSNASSGEAIKNLVEQGTMTLAEVNDNYRYARRLTFQKLLAEVRADLSKDQHDIVVGEGKARKTITLNRRVMDPALGVETTENSVDAANVKVVLEEVPSTSTWRKAMFTQLAEMTKSLPPNVQQFVIDFVIEATDLPERKKVAQRVRRALGIPEPGTEDDAGAQQPAIPPDMQAEIEAQIQQRDAQIAKLTQEGQKVMEDLQAAKAKLLDRDAERVARDRELKIKEDDAAHKRSMEARTAAGEVTPGPGKPQDFEPTIDLEGFMDDVIEEVRPMLRQVVDEVAELAGKVDEVAKRVDAPEVAARSPARGSGGLVKGLSKALEDESRAAEERDAKAEARLAAAEERAAKAQAEAAQAQKEAAEAQRRTAEAMERVSEGLKAVAERKPVARKITLPDRQTIMVEPLGEREE